MTASDNDISQTVIARMCTCGRSATGFCTGLHRLTAEEWDARVFDEVFVKEQPRQDTQS